MISVSVVVRFSKSRGVEPGCSRRISYRKSIVSLAVVVGSAGSVSTCVYLVGDVTRKPGVTSARSTIVLGEPSGPAPSAVWTEAVTRDR
jgi:hypothetical protein